MTSETPSTNGLNGERDGNGRFVKGNPGGPGGPHAQKALQLKHALLEAISPEDIHAIARKLIAQALAGDVAAAKVMLDRALGRAELPLSIKSLPENEAENESQIASLCRLLGLPYGPDEPALGSLNALPLPS